MRKSGVSATSGRTTAKTTFDSAKARFFYQGVFALKRMNLDIKAKSPAQKPTSADSRRRWYLHKNISAALLKSHYKVNMDESYKL